MLSRRGMDKVQWQSYQRKLDEELSYNQMVRERDESLSKVEGLLRQRVETINRQMEENFYQTEEERHQAGEELRQTEKDLQQVIMRQERIEDERQQEEEVRESVKKVRLHTIKSLIKKNFMIQEIAEIMDLTEGRIIDLISHLIEEEHQRAEKASQREREANKRAEKANYQLEQQFQRMEQERQRLEHERRNTARLLKNRNFTVQEIVEVMWLPEEKIKELF